MSPRKLAKAVLFHTRRARIKTLSAPRELPWLRRRLRLPANQILEPLGESLPGHVRVSRLDAAETFARPMPVLPGAPREAIEFFSARTIETTTPSYVAQFEDGVAWGHPTGGVFTADGQFVPAFTHDPAGARLHTVWTRLRLPQPERLAGRALYLVTPEAADNFHHWLIDLLPRLGLVRRAGYHLADFDHVIVNHTGLKYQVETLAHLGIPAEKLIGANEALFAQCEFLVVPSLKANNQTLPAADLAFLRETFLPAVETTTASRRIFLSRGDARYRRLSNEKELYPILHTHGFEIVSPAELSVVSQARLFSEAAVIAGTAGAAFANLVFARTSAQAIEITPPQWLAAFHWMISARSGLPHTVLLGSGPVMKGVPDSSARQLDVVLQPEKLAAALGLDAQPQTQ